MGSKTKADLLKTISELENALKARNREVQALRLLVSVAAISPKATNFNPQLRLDFPEKNLKA